MSDQMKGSFLFDKIGGKICSLSYVHYEINVLDFMMHLQSVQTYENQSTNPQELIYKFFVNETSTIYSIEIEVYNPKTGRTKKMKAEIFEREEAREKYDDSIAQGYTAMLMEEEEGKKDIIELNLGNVGVGWKVTIWMKEVQELDCEKNPVLNQSNTVKLMLPSTNYYGSGKRELEENVSMDMQLKVTQGRILDITSPTHENSLDIIRTPENKQQVHVKTKGMIALSTDFLLHITTVENTKIGVCIVEKDEVGSSERVNEKYSASVSIIPQLLSESNEILTNIIFVLDCSGSMSGSRMRSAKNALTESIEIMSKYKGIRTNIVKFGSSITYLYNKSVLLDESSKDVIMNYINHCSANMGGTNIFDALLFALKEDEEDDDDPSSSVTKQIVFLSDGEDHRVNEIIQFVKKKSSTSRIFSFGIGNGISPVFMNQLAYASNGRTIFIKSGESISDKVVEQFRFILQRSISSIDVHFGEGVKSTCVLRHIPPIYNFQKFSLYYFLDRVPEGDCVRISYVCGSEKVSEEVGIIKSDKISVAERIEEDGKNIVTSNVEEEKKEETEVEEEGEGEKENDEVKKEEKEEEGEGETKEEKEEEEEEDKPDKTKEEEEEERKEGPKSLISILSAKRRVLEIEGYFLQELENMRLGPIEKSRRRIGLKNEIIYLSKKYQFLSSLTSFLLIHVNKDPILDELERKEMEQLLEKKKKEDEERKKKEEEERKKQEEERMKREEEEAKNRRKGGTCYHINSEVFVKTYQSTTHNKCRKKKISEVQVGDFVRSFSSSLHFQ